MVTSWVEYICEFFPDVKFGRSSIKKYLNSSVRFGFEFNKKKKISARNVPNFKFKFKLLKFGEKQDPCLILFRNNGFCTPELLINR